MSATPTKPLAVLAIDETLSMLAAASIEATRDAGAFYPQPIGVLVGLPTLLRRLQGGRVYSIPVLIVSGDPLNAEGSVDRIYAVADDVALVLRADAYRPSSYRSSSNAEPLPAIELLVTVSISEQEAPL